MTKASAKHVPYRTCIGCKATKPKAELIRLVVDSPNTVTIDYSRSVKGRGGYLCGQTTAACLQGALKRRSWGRAFGADVSLSLESFEEVISSLR